MQMGNPRTWTSSIIQCIIFETNVILLLYLLMTLGRNG